MTEVDVDVSSADAGIGDIEPDLSVSRWLGWGIANAEAFVTLIVCTFHCKSPEKKLLQNTSIGLLAIAETSIAYFAVRLAIR